ncbi:MAG: hypothetical protein RLZZ244_1289 [Verrucomicrobiota bacterium]
MNLSKRGEYAIRVLLDLAMAEKLGRTIVPVASLAQAQGIPVAFLEQILLSLRQGGFLASTRGKHGGYSLARSAARIRLGDVLCYLEGPLVNVGCVQPGSEKCRCPDPKYCGLKILMGEVEGALAGVLERHTLESLAALTLERFVRDDLVPAVARRAGEPGADRISGEKGTGQAEPEYLI